MLFFIAIRQGIHVRVVEQRAVALAPWETLCPHAEVLILYEFGARVAALVVCHDAVHSAEDDRRECDEEGHVAPYFIAT